MVLTGVTVAAAFVNLGQFNFLVAMLIAGFKASLVVWYFMHVKYQSQLTKLTVATGLFFLAILLGMMLIDYSSKGSRRCRRRPIRWAHDSAPASKPTLTKTTRAKAESPLARVVLHSCAATSWCVAVAPRQLRSSPPTLVVPFITYSTFTAWPAGQRRRVGLLLPFMTCDCR